MTPVLFLAHAVLAVGWLALAGLGPQGRDRGARVLGTVGVLGGLAVVLLRGSLPVWRAIDIDPTSAAVAGVAVACAWGLTLSLDLSLERWWVGALTGVGSTGLLLFAGSVWTVPALLFLACCAAPTYMALSRSGRAAWVTVAVADVALVAALVSDSLIRDGWAVPASIGGGLLVVVLVAVALRLGLMPRFGPPPRSPAAALIPITTGVGFIVLLRWVERPEPVAAGVALLVAIAAVAWSVLRRSLNPAIVGLWPAASAAGLCLASTRASAAAAVAGILGVTVVVLWPDALERGRLARGFLLSAGIPNLAFGALATAAAGSFASANLDGPAYQVVAWNVVSGLLPVTCASGVALGVFTARADQGGGYHPEAVFMTWVLLAGSVVAGAILGTGAVYGVLGGTPAAILFGAAGAAGVVAASRLAGGDRTAPEYSAAVELTPSLELSRWSVVASVALHVGALCAIAWLTFRGLQVGFL